MAGLNVSASQAASVSGANAEFEIGNLRLVIKQGDITEEKVDAIVNSSNAQLDLSRGLFFFLQFGTTSAEIKVPSAESTKVPLLKVPPFNCGTGQNENVALHAFPNVYNLDFIQLHFLHNLFQGKLSSVVNSK